LPTRAESAIVPNRGKVKEVRAVRCYTLKVTLEKGSSPEKIFGMEVINGGTRLKGRGRPYYSTKRKKVVTCQKTHNKC